MGVSDKLLDVCLKHTHDPLVAHYTREESNGISLYDWHQRMGHHSMQMIIDMANGTVTGLVLKDTPGDLLKLNTCPSCVLTKAQQLPFKSGCMHTSEPLELIHGDLVSPMPVKSVSHCKYGFILMDDYS